MNIHQPQLKQLAIKLVQRMEKGETFPFSKLNALIPHGMEFSSTHLINKAKTLTPVSITYLRAKNGAAAYWHIDEVELELYRESPNAYLENKARLKEAESKQRDINRLNGLKKRRGLDFIIAILNSIK